MTDMNRPNESRWQVDSLVCFPVIVNFKMASFRYRTELSYVHQLVLVIFDVPVDISGFDQSITSQTEDASQWTYHR